MDFPIKKWCFFHSYVQLPEGKDSERFGLKGPERLLTSFEGTKKLTVLVAQRQGSDIPDKQSWVSDVMFFFHVFSAISGSQEEADALGGLLKQRRPIIAAKSLMFYRLATFTMPSSGPGTSRAVFARDLQQLPQSRTDTIFRRSTLFDLQAIAVPLGM